MRHWCVTTLSVFEVQITTKLTGGRVVIKALKGNFVKELHISNLYSSAEIIRWVGYSNSDLERIEYNEKLINGYYDLVTKVWRQYKSDLGNSNNSK